jgi:hypothetical protein
MKIMLVYTFQIYLFDNSILIKLDGGGVTKETLLDRIRERFKLLLRFIEVPAIMYGIL